MPRGRKKRHWLPIVAFLLVATSGIGIGLLIGYALGRLHTSPMAKAVLAGIAAMVVKNVVGVGLQSSYRTPDVFRS
jgi:hypothetical protein